MPLEYKGMLRRVWQRWKQLLARRRIRSLLLIGFAIAIMTIFGWTLFDGASLLSQIREFSWAAIALSLAAVLLQIGCQTARLWLLFPRRLKLSWPQAAIAFIRGQFIGNWVSTQAGYAVKIWHIKPQSESRSSRFSLVGATALIFLDKVVDVTLLLLLSLIGGIWLFNTGHTSWFKAIRQPVVALWNGLHHQPFWILFLLSIFLLLGITAKQIVGGLLQRSSVKILQMRRQVSQAFSFIKSPPQLIGASLMGIGDWIFEMVSLAWLTSAQGYSLNFAQLTICLLILNLGISIPSGLANIGAFEASLTFALTQFGVPFQHSLLIAVVYHLLQLLGISLWYLWTSLWRKSPQASKKILKRPEKIKAN